MHSVTSGELMSPLKLDGVLGGAIHHDGNGLGEFIVVFCWTYRVAERWSVALEVSWHTIKKKKEYVWIYIVGLFPMEGSPAL